MDEVNDAYISSLKWSGRYSSPTVSWDGHCNIMDYISDTYGSSPIQSDINASPVVTCNGDNNIMDNLSGAAIFSPIWSETNTSPMVTWNGTTISPADGLHATSAEQYGDVANPISCTASSSQIAVTTTSGGSNIQECKTSSYAISENNLTHFRYFGSTAAATSFELDRPYSALPTYSSIERKNDELSAFQQSLTFCSGVSSSMGLEKLPDFGYQGNESSSCNLVETTPQNGSFYSDIYHSASMPIEEQNDLLCLSSFLVERQTNLIADSLQPKMEPAGLHSPSLPSGTCLMSSNEAARISMAQQAQIDSIDLSSFLDGHRKSLISSALLPKMEQNGLYSLAFSSGPSMMTSNKLAGLPSAQKLATSSQAYAVRHQIYDSSGSQSHFVPDTGNHCNEPDKPRVRARRGEATDPHSIAEKHRRKRISERLKDLQRLVPGANKTDKASILDEIINYVRFLQLQVEGNLFPSASVGRGRSDHTDTDSLAFKQQILNLMEVDVTSAAQYLEDRGLSLIPMASAAKISMQRGAFAVVPH